MQTDVPLKRLTQLCPADLLHLLNSPQAEVVAVESLELPASKTSLDTVLRLRQPDGTEYLHLIEWQGYRDPQFLWRTLGYLSWLGQNRPERPILVTIIYLHPGDDIGDTLVQELPDVQKWLIGLPCIRLWQQDAGKALARRVPGLAALSPLMDYATPERIEEAAEIILQNTSAPVQEELLTVLGIFAEGRLEPERLARFIARERIMASSFIQYVFREELAEQKEREASLQQQVEAAQQQVEAAQQQVEAAQQQVEAAQQQIVSMLTDQGEQIVSMLVDQSEETAMLRFPDLQARYIRNIRQLTDVDALRELHRALVLAPDQPAAERILAALAER